MNEVNVYPHNIGTEGIQSGLLIVKCEPLSDQIFCSLYIETSY